MPTDQNITLGTEVEYPMAQPSVERTTFEKPAHYSGPVRDDVREDYGRRGWPDAEVGSDPTAGLELRSDPMGPDELADWYRMTIAELTKYAPHEPTGLSGTGCSASTIGLHLHFSPYDDETARALYDISCEPWFRIFACSSIVEGSERTSFQLFRDSYCAMRFDDGPGSSNSCVTLINGRNKHWEWRLLEPITPDHFDLVIEFMKRLKRDPDEARDYARDLVDNVDPRLTAVKRAQKIGLVEKLETPDDEPSRGYDVTRTPVRETRDWFDTVLNSSEAPYIYHVTDDDDEHYYVLYSENYSRSDDPFRFNGVQFQHDDALDADSLSPITDHALTAELQAAVEHERRGMEHPRSPTKTSATDELVERIATAGIGTAFAGGGD